MSVGDVSLKVLDNLLIMRKTRVLKGPYKF